MDVALVDKGSQLFEEAGSVLLGLVPAALQFFRGEVEGGQVIGQLIHRGEGLRPVRVAGAGKAQGLDPVVRCPLAGGNHAQVEHHLPGCLGSVGGLGYQFRRGGWSRPVIQSGVQLGGFGGREPGLSRFITAHVAVGCPLIEIQIRHMCRI